jgi:dihydroneopterin aldolase
VLVETIAERLAESLLLHERVRAVTVQVEKLDIIAAIVGVKIRRERAHEQTRRPLIAALGAADARKEPH